MKHDCPSCPISIKAPVSYFLSYVLHFFNLFIMFIKVYVYTILLYETLHWDLNFYYSFINVLDIN